MFNRDALPYWATRSIKRRVVTLRCGAALRLVSYDIGQARRRAGQIKVARFHKGVREVRK